MRAGAAKLELAGRVLSGPPPQIGQLCQLQIPLIRNKQVDRSATAPGG